MGTDEYACPGVPNGLFCLRVGGVIRKISILTRGVAITYTLQVSLMNKGTHQKPIFEGG
ncbi:MAG: hypothetical protein RL326_1284 [Pseudomonadota bacterium]|jgi:hypothetical protein